MAKHVEKLGSLDDFVAPWETGAGEVEIDKSKLKRYIFNLSLDKAKAQDARDETAEKVEEIQGKLREAQAEGDSTGKIAGLQKELDEAKDKASKAEGKLLKLEIGAEKGLTPKQAARLQGSTKEELEADADEILETFGVAKPGKTGGDDDDQDDDGDDDLEPRRVPKLLTNPADSASKTGAGEYDYEKVVAGFSPRIL